jgi:hypothetical protein
LSEPSPPGQYAGFRPHEFVLDLSAVLFEGLQSPPQSPEDRFGIVRIMPACPQLPNDVSLQVEAFASFGYPLVCTRQMAVHRVHASTNEGRIDSMRAPVRLALSMRREESPRQTWALHDGATFECIAGRETASGPMMVGRR